MFKKHSPHRHNNKKHIIANTTKKQYRHLTNANTHTEEANSKQAIAPQTHNQRPTKQNNNTKSQKHITPSHTLKETRTHNHTHNHIDDKQTIAPHLQGATSQATPKHTKTHKEINNKQTIAPQKEVHGINRNPQTKQQTDDTAKHSNQTIAITHTRQQQFTANRQQQHATSLKRKTPTQRKHLTTHKQ